MNKKKKKAIEAALGYGWRVNPVASSDKAVAERAYDLGVIAGLLQAEKIAKRYYLAKVAATRIGCEALGLAKEAKRGST